MNKTEKRKPAIRLSDITEELRKKLNTGQIESITLVETLAINHAELLRSVIPTMPQALIDRLEAAKSIGITQRMALAGELLFNFFGQKAFDSYVLHPSDTVRSWTAYVIAKNPSLELHERLYLIRILADDAHSGVREWAWLALRPIVASNIEKSIELLLPWTKETSPYLRRFATEITRPRGVWCKHIELLKMQPELGLPLLEPLRYDTEKYVQDSVGNWLNDAAKSKPEWVQELCEKWLKESNQKETIKICKKALRSL